MENVEGKVAFITGGASGLGLAMARSLTGAGMKVVLADIEQKALEAAWAEFEETNADVLTMKVDVTSREAMEQAANETIEAFGKVHVLCNNAGVAISGNIADMSYADWDWVNRVNYDGVVNGMVAFTNHIKAHGEGGHIVNTASLAGQIGVAGLSVYNATKFAVVGMSEAMRGDLEPFNIGTSVLCPGFVETGIYSSERNRPSTLGGEEASKFDLGREESGSIQDLPNLMQPEVIGDMVLHAIQNNVFYIFSHTEAKEGVAMRGQAISDAFDYWQGYRTEHNV